MRGTWKTALAILVIAACGRDGAITEPTSANAPNVLLLGPILATGVDTLTGATIVTNKDDYMPGEIVHVSGHGWAAGETVNLHMTEEPDTHADVDTSIVVDASGAFSVHYYSVHPSDLGVTFTLTATGSTSHSVAVATFTDGNVGAKSSPSAVPTFTNGSYVKYNGNTTCGVTGTNTPGTFTVNSTTFTTVVGLQAGQSLKLSVPATLPGYAFSSWTVPSPAVVVSGSLTNPSDLCIRIGDNNDKPDLTVNYVVSNVAPTINAGGPYNGTEGSAISLGGPSGATASDPDAGDVLTYKWTVNKSGIDTGGDCSFSPSDAVLNPSVTCTDDSQGAPGGKFSLTLEVKDGVGGHTVTDNADLTVNNVAPTATISVPSPLTQGQSFTVTLNGGTDVGANDIPDLQYAFDCGDGAGYNAFGAASSRSCTASQLNSQTVKGRIRDQDGGENEFQTTVPVNNTAPTANAGGPYSGAEGSPIGLTGAASSDPNGTIATYAWTYVVVSADPGASCNIANANTVTPSITCNDDGAYSVRLVVTDNGGASSTQASANLTVSNVAPTAVLTAPPSAALGSTFGISLGSAADAGSNDIGDLQYSFDCGAGYDAFNATPSRTCTATTIPTQIVKGKIRDQDGGENEYTASVAITNVPPTANAGGPYSGNEGSAINISGSGNDPDGGTVSYLWSVTPVGKCSFGNATMASTTVTCTDNGAFTLTLKVTDDESAFTNDDATLTVNNVAPTIGTHTLGVSVNEGSSIPFAVGGVADPSSDDQAAGFTYAFSCDGAPYGAFGVSNTTDCPAGDGPGSVTIAGKARDKDGGVSDPVSSTFTVLNVKPTITAVSHNSPVNEGSNATLTVTTVTDPFPGDLVGATYSFACNGGSYGGYSGTNSVSCPTTDGPATITIGAKVKDKDGAESDPFTQNITVANVPPTVTGVTAPSSVNEGPGTFAFSATGVTDPSTADVSAGFDYAFSCDNGGSWTSYSTTNSGTCSAADGPATIIVAVKAKDKDGGESTPVTKSVTVVNLKPTVTGVTAPSSVDEGPSFNFSASGVTDPSAVDQAAGFNYAFSCNNGATWSAFSGTNSGACAAPDGPATINVAVRARDKDGAESDAVSASVTINNVAPILNVGAAAASLNEGSTFSRSGSFTDPGADTWTATVNYGDGGGNQPLTLSAGKTFSLSHLYPQDGIFTVTVSIDDGDEGFDTKTITVTVNNVLPTVGAFAGGSISESGTYSSSGSFTDPGADTWTATVNYGDGTGTLPLVLSGKNFTLNHTYNDDDGSPFTVTVTVNDDDGSGNGQASVIVLNVGPVITTPLVLPTSPVAMGSTFSMTWTFTDPGNDAWKCKISWDQPVVLGAAVNSTGKTCSISGASLTPGVYTVTVYVEDDDGGNDQETAESYIVVYDPTGGFVTGGGWINSLPGFYRLNTSAEGKANFGFVSKYVPGRTVPTGNTEFQFHAGSLNFKSTVYEWLVVAGTKAMYKGEGTIAGQTGVYGFLLSAIDGSPDKFRIKIWEKTTGNVVYDTLPVGAEDDADPTTALGGGSIVVHNKK